MDGTTIHERRVGIESTVTGPYKLRVMDFSIATRS